MVEEEVKAEVEGLNPTVNRVKYAYFVSCSKGKGRKRKQPTEVHLVSLSDSRFYLWHKAPFDVYASEILGFSGDRDNKSPEEYLREEIKKIWGY